MQIKRNIVIIFSGTVLLTVLLLSIDINKFDKFLRKRRLIKYQDYNVIMVSITNLRPKNMSLYGYGRKTTPNIDLLGRYSLVFEKAYTHASWTLPASMSLFTSLYPFEHKIYDDRINNNGDVSILKKEVVTLIDVLKNAGYITAAFTGGRDYIPLFGLLSRFDHYQYHMFPDNKKHTYDIKYLWAQYGTLERILPAALKWVENKKKFFLFMQSYEVHSPFAVPKRNKKFDPFYKGKIDFKHIYWNYESEDPISINGKEYYKLNTSIENKKGELLFGREDIDHMIALYDGEILNMDKTLLKLFRFLKKKKLFDNTIVIILAEHGDMLGEHGRFMRSGPIKDTFYDPVLHIPLMIYHPGMIGKRINDIVEVIDIAPILLDFLGIDIPGSFRGIKLGKNKKEYAYAYSEYNPTSRETIFKDKVRIMSVRNTKWKLIIEEEKNGDLKKIKKELYDITNDKNEMKNLNTKKPGILRKLEERLMIKINNSR